MGVFEFLGVSVFLYYVVQVASWIFLDSDIQLFIAEKVGKPISALRGQVVWVTGASSGIGKYLAIVLAKNGVKLCISARREEELEKVKQECLKVSTLDSKDILVLKMDMIDINNQKVAFDKVISHFGRLDVLVNNAGRSQRAKWQEVDLNVDRELFELDVFSAVNLSRIYIKYVEAHTQKGHIAITSSTAGVVGVPNSCSYVGAKHALHGYFNSLHVEMPNIDVTLFCPGPTTTEFLNAAFTHETGKSYGATAQSSGKRMSAERCGFLMATAMANKLRTNFVGPFPVPMLASLTSYYPNLTTLLLKMIGGAKGLQKIRDPEKKND